ncbi:uncharacterized protein EV420DRAFT_1541005 [Desarmillaria tabescens]|uniref:Uncharacterized protein n=1 Tax=Armillaria tabescens TaxID=1929756 RepID=A0AA39KFM6_ARMTA|nr:uncharacterized protein EV420DRAFT_1541005 [Desarmillaria tabescens]KAK0458889.1 hypothetical protein EV420DRAFT_1541005 [Desarmillaria tabescens]
MKGFLVYSYLPVIATPWLPSSFIINLYYIADVYCIFMFYSSSSYVTWIIFQEIEASVLKISIFS